MTEHGNLYDLKGLLNDFAKGKEFDDGYKLTITKVRNYNFHKKYWSFVGKIAIEQNLTPDHVDFILKIETDHFDLVGYNGHYVKKPKSISFAAMDEIEFNTFYNNAVNKAFEIWTFESQIEDILIRY